MGQVALAGVEPAHVAGNDAEPLGAAELGRGLEGELHPEAQAEHRHAARDALAHELVEAEPAQLLHPARERADPRAG